MQSLDTLRGKTGMKWGGNGGILFDTHICTLFDNDWQQQLIKKRNIKDYDVSIMDAAAKICKI